MKKRRSTIIALLLVAALALGIGYAALTDDLFITGSAGIKQEHAEDAFGADVYFTRAVISGEKGTATIGADTHSEANDQITITAAEGAFKGAGDSVLTTVEITNAGDLAASVKLNSALASNAEYFEVTTNWGTEDKVIAAGAKVTFEVYITCIKTPTSDVSTTFDIGFTATAVEG